MIQTDERKMLRALEKIAENTGRLYREAVRIADALEPDVLLVSTESQGEALPEPHEVTAEEALTAAKTIKAFCLQNGRESCARNCAIENWCVNDRSFAPDDWDVKEDAHD